MKQLPLVTGLLYTAPWAILAHVHGELSGLYRNYLQGTLNPAALEGSGRVSSGISYQSDVASGIAILHVEGIIAKRAPDILCGPQIADLAKLDGLIEEIAADDRFHTVVLDLNSPGGCMIGLEETCAALVELAETKRLVAYTDFQACSAAYYIACACDEFYAAPSACIGSINTYIAAIDSHRAWEMEGFELKLYRGGELKAIGHPGKAFTAEEDKFLQDSALAATDQFHNWVRERRGAIEESALQGQWFFAKAAPAGLIDGLHPSLKSLLAMLMADSSAPAV
jgi:ClpP class serine protease